MLVSMKDVFMDAFTHGDWKTLDMSEYPDGSLKEQLLAVRFKWRGEEVIVTTLHAVAPSRERSIAVLRDWQGKSPKNLDEAFDVEWLDINEFRWPSGYFKKITLYCYMEAEEDTDDTEDRFESAIELAVADMAGLPDVNFDVRSGVVMDSTAY